MSTPGNFEWKYLYLYCREFYYNNDTNDFYYIPIFVFTYREYQEAKSGVVKIYEDQSSSLTPVQRALLASRPNYQQYLQVSWCVPSNFIESMALCLFISIHLVVLSVRYKIKKKKRSKSFLLGKWPLGNRSLGKYLVVFIWIM